MNVYLDNAATTRLDDETISYVNNVIRDVYGNANSHHSVGDKARILVEEARNSVANFINANPSEIIFTPSGSASNTLGLQGAWSFFYEHIWYYSPIAHKSIINCLESIDESIEKIKINSKGVLSTEWLLGEFEKDWAKPFVIIDYANSEIGTIQNVKEIIDLTHKYGGSVYLDCTASIPYIKTDVKELDADMIGFSGHKLGALKGVGVLYKKNEIQLEPIIYGAQENGLVGGTYNVPAIASLGYVLSSYNYSIHSDSSKRDYLLNKIFNSIDKVRLIGSKEQRIPNNLNLCFKGVNAARLIVMLDSKGIQVSSGSACNSGNAKPSYVLKAIRMSNEDALSCIRITLSGKETYDELDYVSNILKLCVDTIRDGDR